MSKGSHAATIELLTVNKAAAYLKCSKVFLWKLRKKGYIETVHAGNKVLLPKSSINNFLQLRQLQKSNIIDIVNPVNPGVNHCNANVQFFAVPQEILDVLAQAAKEYMNNKKEVVNA